MDAPALQRERAGDLLALVSHRTAHDSLDRRPEVTIELKEPKRCASPIS
ncbi:hypothetical protein [Kitasatospora sp. HPMI-4]